MPDRERVYRTEALILKHSDFGEADRLVTVFTPYYGKLRLLAKGARKPSSRKAGHLESFTRTQLLVARGRNLDIITQAQMVESYAALRRDLWRVSNAYYIGELADAFGEELAENRPMYDLLCRALGWVSELPNLRQALRVFELRLLDVVGYRPELFHCVGCKAAIEPDDNYFSAQEGGVLCPRCGKGRGGARTIPLAVLKVLRHMQTHDDATCLQLRLQPSTLSMMEQVQAEYLTHVLERRLKSVEFLHLLRPPTA